MTFTVVATAAQTLLQDRGRAGYAHLGVPRSGAFDRRSWHLANRLLGNAETAAALECLGGGLELRAERHTTVVVGGALGDVYVDRIAHTVNQPLHLRPGQHLRLAPPRIGLRYYVAVSGGFTATPVLGSISRDTLGGLGPVVEVGAVLVAGSSRGTPHVDHTPARQSATTFLVRPGPDLPVAALLDRDWDLDPQSDRIGVRLSGEPITAPSAILPSRPMILGAVQLPPSGLPIILGPDHPTTGGYPLIAVVTADSMDDVAQWAGGPRRFRLAQ